MIHSETTVSILTDDLERIDFPVGNYGFDSWYWGLHEATRDTYAAMFPIYSSSDRATDFHAVSHWVAICEGTEEHESPEEERECDRCLEGMGYALDALVDQMNETTGAGYLWHYQEGELYLSPLCDVETEDEEECTYWDSGYGYTVCARHSWY